MRQTLTNTGFLSPRSSHHNPAAYHYLAGNTRLILLKYQVRSSYGLNHLTTASPGLSGFDMPTTRKTEAGKLQQRGAAEDRICTSFIVNPLILLVNILNALSHPTSTINLQPLLCDAPTHWALLSPTTLNGEDRKCMYFLSLHDTNSLACRLHRDESQVGRKWNRAKFLLDDVAYVSPHC